MVNAHSIEYVYLLYLSGDQHAPVLLGIFSQRTLAEEAQRRIGSAPTFIREWELNKVVNKERL